MPQCAEFFYANHILCAGRLATGAVYIPSCFYIPRSAERFSAAPPGGLVRSNQCPDYLVSRLSWLVAWLVIDDSNQTLSGALLSESSPLPCNEPRNRKPHGTTTELASWCGTPSCLSIDGFLLKRCGVDLHHARTEFCEYSCSRFLAMPCTRRRG